MPSYEFSCYTTARGDSPALAQAHLEQVLGDVEDRYGIIISIEDGAPTEVDDED